MSRPRKLERFTQTHLRLPEALMAEVNLQLFSVVQQRVPLGALSEFFERAARRELDLIKAAQRGVQNANAG